MAFCINCGNQLPDGAKFCMNCGTPVPAVPQSAPETISEPTPEPIPEPIPEPTSEPIPEPTIEPAPEAEPEPVPQPAPAPAMQFTQVQPADVDDDLNMEGPPIVGSYSMPVTENAAQPASAKRPKSPKQPRQGGVPRKIVVFAVGGVIALAVVITAVVLIIKAVGGSSKKAEGTGTALTELLDDAARTYYNGNGMNSSADGKSQDETKDIESESTDEEESSDASSGNEKLYQGCINASLPAGFVQGGSDGTSEEEFYREDDKDKIIKIHISSSKGSARSAAEDDVQWWIDNNGGDGYEIADDLKAGNYTWTVEHFPFNGENSSAKFYADVTDKYHLEVICFMMNENDPDALAFLESVHMEDGDPGKLRSEWLDSRNK